MAEQGNVGRTYRAAVKWQYGADKPDIDRELQHQLPILALDLIEEHGFTIERIEELFEAALDAARYEVKP